MSFDWNLSSEDEFEAEDEKEEPLFSFGNENKGEEEDTKSGGIPTSALASLPPVTATTYSDDDDDDDIDWEDAGDEESVDLDDHRKSPPAAVTIDMDSKPAARSDSKGNKKKRRRSRKVYRYKSLPPTMQSLLRNLHQTHILCLMSRAIYISQTCSNAELLHVANSLVPRQFESAAQEVPSVQQFQQFSSWYFEFINRVDERRRAAVRANLAAGAPRPRRRKRRYAAAMTKATTGGFGTACPATLLRVCSYLSQANDENPQMADEDDSCITNHDKAQLLVTMARSLGWRARYVTALDTVKFDLDMDHPLLLSGAANVFRLVAQERMDGAAKKKSKRGTPTVSNGTPILTSEEQSNDHAAATLGWVEISCRPKRKNAKQRWIHIDPANEWIDRPRLVESLFLVNKLGGIVNTKKTRTIAYALAVEHLPRQELDDNLVRLTDVTPRYSNSWSQSLKLRGVDGKQKSIGNNDWWTESIRKINLQSKNSIIAQCGHVFGEREVAPRKQQASGNTTSEAIEVGDSSDEHENIGASITKAEDAVDEQTELMESATREKMPTNKAAFKSHPVYALASQMGVNEVLAPDAKSRFCGMFKGELVYRRHDVSTAMVAKKWLYQGRKVKDEEMPQPVKRVKARKKPTPKGFKPLKSYGVGESNDGSEEARQREVEKASAPKEQDDGKQDLYAFWQTQPWAPDPVGPNDAIPTNEYNNIELAFINPGLVHLEAPRMSVVAKKLGIPYAPCLLGFEGHGGNRTPTIRGIVVHEHNVELLNEAYTEYQSQAIENEHHSRQQRILRRWKKLINGVLIKDRVDREYGGKDDDK